MAERHPSNRPLIIGQCLNNAGSRSVAAALAQRDAGAIAALARRQADAGADCLDLCAAGRPDEAEALAWLAGVVQDSVALPLCLDSPDPVVLRHVVPLCRRPPLLNGVSGLSVDSAAGRDLLGVAPGLQVVALCYDGRTETDASERLAIAVRLAARVGQAGVPAENIVFDPVTLPSRCGDEARGITLSTLRALRIRFPEARLLCAVSNFGHGLSPRRPSERAWAADALAAGADTFLCDPRDRRLVRLLRSE